MLSTNDFMVVSGAVAVSAMQLLTAVAQNHKAKKYHEKTRREVTDNIQIQTDEIQSAQKAAVDQAAEDLKKVLEAERREIASKINVQLEDCLKAFREHLPGMFEHMMQWDGNERRYQKKGF